MSSIFRGVARGFARGFVARTLLVAGIAGLAATVTGCRADEAGSAEADEQAQTAGAAPTLAEAAKVLPLSSVCANGQADRAVCAALDTLEKAGLPQERAGAQARAAQTIHEKLRVEGADALRDKAVQYYVRERGIGLFLRHAATDGETQHLDGDDYDRAVRARVTAHLPAYTFESFSPGYQVPSPQRTCTKKELFIFAPGFFRVSKKDELGEIMDAFSTRFPCVVTLRSEPKQAASVDDSAEALKTVFHQALATYGDVAVHLAGHSAGAATVVRALARDPELAARTRTVVSLQPIARGTEFLDPFDGVLSPEGIRSMTKQAADDFWNNEGGRLPGDALFLTLRGAVAPESVSEDIPLSNRAFYEILKAAGLRDGSPSPHNDMQVRLARQYLGGRATATEVLSRVVEGNHYQWGLTSSEIPSLVMPADMLDRIPRRSYWLGYYSALQEIGVFAKE